MYSVDEHVDFCGIKSRDLNHVMAESERRSGWADGTFTALTGQWHSISPAQFSLRAAKTTKQILGNNREANKNKIKPKPVAWPISRRPLDQLLLLLGYQCRTDQRVTWYVHQQRISMTWLVVLGHFSCETKWREIWKNRRGKKSFCRLVKTGHVTLKSCGTTIGTNVLFFPRNSFIIHVQ